MKITQICIDDLWMCEAKAFIYIPGSPEAGHHPLESEITPLLHTQLQPQPIAHKYVLIIITQK